MCCLTVMQHTFMHSWTVSEGSQTSGKPQAAAAGMGTEVTQALVLERLKQLEVSSAAPERREAAKARRRLLRDDPDAGCRHQTPCRGASCRAAPEFRASGGWLRPYSAITYNDGFDVHVHASIVLQPVQWPSEWYPLF